MNTPSQQAYIQAKLDFMTSVLRKESGAAISVGEFLNEDRRYFPQPGESQDVIANKTRAREQLIRTFQVESGRKLLPPQVVPFQGPGTLPKVNVPQAVEAIRGAPLRSDPGSAGGGTPPPPNRLVEGLGALAGPVPQKVLPVPLGAQQRTAPDVAPKATESIDRLARMELVGPMKSSAINSGAADEHLRAIGYEALMRNMSYFKNPAQKAAIRSRMKKLDITPSQ